MLPSWAYAKFAGSRLNQLQSFPSLPPSVRPDYLLSNNHVNSIIVHKFDFSDEEIMAYYISFLKTLSLKLNNHTVHFFYNEVRQWTTTHPEVHPRMYIRLWRSKHSQILVLGLPSFKGLILCHRV